MKINSEAVTTANLDKAQAADLNVETKLMPPYLRYSIPAKRTQIEAIIRAAKRELLLSGPALEANSQAIGGRVGSLVSNPHLEGGTISPSVSSIRGRSAASLNEILSPAQPATKNPAILANTENKKVTVPGAIVPDGVVSVGWYCPTEFRVNCFTGQTHTIYIYDLYCGQEKFYLGTNNNGTLYFQLDGQTYGLGAMASNGILPIKVVCEVLGGKSNTIELPVTLSFVNQPPCISLQSASFPDEQVPCELVGDNHGQRPKIRVNLTAPAGPSGQTVFLIMDDPHNPAVGRWVNPGIDSFVIPAGQTSGEWEGFLGTRKVLAEKTITIRARMNGQESQGLTIKVKRN